MTNYRHYDAPKREQRVTITWERIELEDDSSDTPDEWDEGFWPSRDKNAAGYVLPENYESEHAKAKERMRAWSHDEWRYIGIAARAHISIPSGQGSFTTYTLDSAGLFGLESDCGDYLNDVFQEEKDALLADLQRLGMAIHSGEVECPPNRAAEAPVAAETVED